MKKKKQDMEVITRREYKHDRAMLEAVRKSAWHPKPISMITTVPEFNKLTYPK